MKLGATCLLAVVGIAPAAADWSGLESSGSFDAPWTELSGSRPAQWRVVWTTDPARTATIAWTTAEAGEEHVVHLEPEGVEEEAARVVAATRNGRYSRSSADDSEAWYHHARVEDLSPNTTYRFRLESDGQRSPELRFRTAPAGDRPVAILAGGDSRTGHAARMRVNASIARRIAADPELLAFSHGGDYVANGDRWDQWSAWLSHHELATSADGRVLPIVPTRGNHDYGPLYDEVFDAPGRRDGWFRTQLSSRVSLLTLNSNVSAAGRQLTWLQRDLQFASGTARWIVVSYHRPLYPAVKTPGPAKGFWTPVFDRFGVDLALESDGHCIKRTLPIRDDEPDPEGVVYVGEGGLGVPQRTPRTDEWYLEPPGFAARGHHVLRLDFSTEELRVRFLRFALAAGGATVDPSGVEPELVDEFTRAPRER